MKNHNEPHGWPEPDYKDPRVTCMSNGKVYRTFDLYSEVTHEWEVISPENFEVSDSSVIVHEEGCEIFITSADGRIYKTANPFEETPSWDFVGTASQMGDSLFSA